METSAKRVLSLDILRVVAVGLVFGAHIALPPDTVNPYLLEAVTVWKRGGFVGVDIFFVLSGFLVSGLLFQEYQRYGTVNIRQFLIRRGFKLYPSLWFLTIAGVIIRYPVEPYRVIGELLFLQNYLGNIWVHTWSLAVEEHFYLLLAAFVAYWVARTRGGNPFQAIPLLFGVVLVLCLALRIVLGVTIEYDKDIHVFPTHLRLDSLMVGVFIAYCWYFRGLQTQTWWRRARWGLLVAGILLLVPAFIWEQGEDAPWTYIVGYNLFYTGSAALLLSFLAFDLGASAIATRIAQIGSYSYSIYIWHVPIETLARAHIFKANLIGTNSWYLYAIVYLSGSVILGIIAFRLIEYPFVRLRDYWFPRVVSTAPHSTS